MASSYHQQRQLEHQQQINNSHYHQQQHSVASFQQQQPPVGIHPQDVFPSNTMQNQSFHGSSHQHFLHHDGRTSAGSASSPSQAGGSFSMRDFTTESSALQQNPQKSTLSSNGKNSSNQNTNGSVGASQESSHVYSAVYSGVSVFEMMCRNVAVMRRQKDSYLNATQVLKVANIEKGKRTKILEKEILNKEHEKVQGGYGKYQGTWIPFERGLDLAIQYRVADLLRPLFEFDPDTASDNSHLAPPPSQPRAPSRRTSGPNSSAKNNNAQNQQQQQVESANKRMKMDSTHTYVESPEHQQRDLYLDDSAGFGGEQQQFFEFHDPKVYAPPHHMHMHHYQAYYNVDPYGVHHQFNSQHMDASEHPHIAAAAENSAERHRASIMSLFLNQAGGGNAEHVNEELVLSRHTMMAPDFDINLILDDQGHTALHWASALANVKMIPSLLQKGARLDFLNYAGESALIRSVMVSHNYDRQSFLDLLSLLRDIICIADKKNRTVLHHICLSASSKGRVNSCIYYMQCILEFYANSVHDEAVSSEMLHSDQQNSLSSRFRSILNVVDICGDTAVNIASRLGNRHLFDLLVDAGADVSIPNYATLKPSDYGFEALNHPSSQTTPVMATVLYPSIKTDQENVYSDKQQQHQMQQHDSSEKSQTEVIAELQAQLSALSREVSHYRKAIGPLEVENAEIPLLKYRILSLENTIKEKAYNRGGGRSSADQTPTSSQGQEGVEGVAGNDEEILRLRESLVHQKAVEAHLCQEIKTLRATASQHESLCKRIISECCNVPLENVAEILEPLLDCVETSDSFSLDSRLVSSFMDGIRSAPHRLEESSL